METREDEVKQDLVARQDHLVVLGSVVTLEQQEDKEHLVQPVLKELVVKLVKLVIQVLQVKQAQEDQMDHQDLKDLEERLEAQAHQDHLDPKDQEVKLE